MPFLNLALFPSFRSSLFSSNIVFHDAVHLISFLSSPERKKSSGFALIQNKGYIIG
jgi:hypothetical protein